MIPQFATLESLKHPDYPFIFGRLPESLAVIVTGFVTALFAEAAYGLCFLILEYRRRRVVSAPAEKE